MIRRMKAEVDSVLPADPEAPSCAHCHGNHTCLAVRSGLGGSVR